MAAQYAERGLAGLEDAPCPGGPKTVLTDEAVCQILSPTVTPPPEPLRAAGVTHWSSRRLAGAAAGYGGDRRRPATRGAVRGSRRGVGLASEGRGESCRPATATPE